MRGGEFDETLFFRAIQDAGVRALLIGRRALVLLGLPVLTADYDFWIAIDDIAAFNEARLLHLCDRNRRNEHAGTARPGCQPNGVPR